MTSYKLYKSMLDIRRRTFLKHFATKAILAVIGLTLFCEFIIYYIVLMQCRWPNLDNRQIDLDVPPTAENETPVSALFLADTHLLGPRNGHWFDKLRREWQMYRTFQTAMAIFKPDVVFILGDIFDEGQSCSSVEFESYTSRFQSLFDVPQHTLRYVVAGNHDIGFHYAITRRISQRFSSLMNSSNIRTITIKGNHFILINSMAFEGDGCSLCRSAEIALVKIGKRFRCAKGVSTDCQFKNSIKRYSKPILLQHFPMYRKSDEDCHEMDEAPADIKNVKYRERWDVLSEEASDILLNTLSPRLIVDGHTHHGCRNIHRNNVLEMTLSSFNWRNKDNPSFLLGVFTPNNYALSKCYMPVESVVIKIYILGTSCIIAYLLMKLYKTINHMKFRKCL